MKYRDIFEDLKQRKENQDDLAYVYRYGKKMSQIDFMRQLDLDISEDDLYFIYEISNRLENYEPAQYLVGDTDFYNLNLKLDKRVLIPRPETEELVDLILRDNSSKDGLKILDLGTGSGAIGLSLKKAKPSWEITLADLSDDALEVARENALFNNLAVDTIKSDVFSNIFEKFDIIVSNPPYISQDEVKYMDRSVLEYEPNMALFADNDGLLIYQKIAQEASDYLKEEGRIYLEIGFKQASAVQDLFTKNMPNKKVQIFQDFAGVDRMVRLD